MSWLEGVVSGCTVPPHIKVRHHYIALGNEGDGFVVTLIPKSDHAPHQVVVHGKYQYQYYIRAGSSFEHTPHAVLAGMFGRRPQPDVDNRFLVHPAELVVEDEEKRVRVTWDFLLRNKGVGLASDIFISLMIYHSIGKNCQVFFEALNRNCWVETFSLGGRRVTLVSKPDFRLPPDSDVESLRMGMLILPPFENKLEVNGICGCGQAPSCKIRIENDGEAVKNLYYDFLEKCDKGLLTVDVAHSFAIGLMNQKDGK